ncbi:hypothetical protein L0B52_08240 [Suttonella sp. R2A3]|uniref:SDH family Clp fold serine proteinase n=1 Tax=Suttonella sp. R2A3 TaxID=2908648 RepID=UPI001F1D3BAE|nr:hypothetical protein [Suttonella sp. R2A3]UJF24312.1 hypothetical protein L0B52_08240 [Suttonella sp. R2A3]
MLSKKNKLMITKKTLDKYDGHVILYYGGISREGYQKLSGALERIEEKKKKVCLVLITYGGDPDPGYRIARALKHHFHEVEILIPDICKSAGTLICIGANKLIFGDRGELGPLDIQLSKPDEIFESMSGLDIIQALNALENQVLGAFRRYLMDIRDGSRLRTKLAADIATKLASGFISPMSSKIDPVTLGEHQRAMQIAYDYGERLNSVTNSLKPDSLIKLISGYPSHSFVIDRKEASTLFSEVEAPDESTVELYEWALCLLPNVPYPQSPMVLNLVDFVENTNAVEEQQDIQKGDINED